MKFAGAVLRRGARAAERARRMAADEIADLVEQEMAGVSAEITAEGVLMRGRRLGRRAEHDPRLRWLTAFWKGRR